MRVLVDTNVVLDWWLEREPFAREAQMVLSAIESGWLEGYLCATSVTTLHYLAAKSQGPSQARKTIESLLQFLEVASVNRAVLALALTSPMKDYEDAVMAYAAREAGIDAIVTRDRHGFHHAPVRILSCSELIRQLDVF